MRFKVIVSVLAAAAAIATALLLRQTPVRHEPTPAAPPTGMAVSVPPAPAGPATPPPPVPAPVPGNAGPTDTAGTPDQAPAPSPQGPLWIELGGNGLSLQAQEASLQRILYAISEATGVPIAGIDSLPDRPVTLNWRDVPPEQALEVLLEPFDAFFYRSADPGSPAALRTVWVYPRGGGQGVMPVPPQAWASTQEAEQDLHSPERERQLRALELVIRRQGPLATDRVLEFLRSPDEEVRTRALDAAVQSGLEMPSDTLLGVIQSDPSATARVLAIKALMGDLQSRDRHDPNLRTAAELAVQDPDSSVQVEGQILFDWLATPAEEEPGTAPGSAAPADWPGQ